MQNREQAEDLAGAVHRERRDIAEGRRDAGCEAAARDAVDAVTRIAFVEHDLAAAELATAPREAQLLVGHLREDIHGHAATVRECEEDHIRMVWTRTVARVPRA